MRMASTMSRMFASVIARCCAVALVAVSGSACWPVSAALFGNDQVTLTINAVDPDGKPVPWVTLGASWTPYPPLTSDAGGWPRLEPADLRRLLIRNSEAWEYWNRFSRPLMYLRFRGLTDQRGVLRDTIDYVEAAGRGSEWPAELTVAYGAYRHGYEPVTAQVAVHKRDRRLEVTLVMKPSANYSTKLPEYLQTLYEIRHELADWRRNEDVSTENHERLENFRRRLTQAAEAAASAGDRKAAARIMYWVAYTPEVQVRNGKAIGFTQANEDSTRNYDALKRAAEYDPENAHVQAQFLSVQVGWWMAEERRGNLEWSEVKKLRREWLDQAIALDRRAGGQLWPRFHDHLEGAYGFFELRKQQIEKLEWLRVYEPAWRGADYYDSSIRVARQRMTQK